MVRSCPLAAQDSCSKLVSIAKRQRRRVRVALRTPRESKRVVATSDYVYGPGRLECRRLSGPGMGGQVSRGGVEKARSWPDGLSAGLCTVAGRRTRKGAGGTNAAGALLLPVGTQ